MRVFPHFSSIHRVEFEDPSGRRFQPYEFEFEFNSADRADRLEWKYEQALRIAAQLEKKARLNRFSLEAFVPHYFLTPSATEDIYMAFNMPGCSTATSLSLEDHALYELANEEGLPLNKDGSYTDRETSFKMPIIGNVLSEEEVRDIKRSGQQRDQKLFAKMRAYLERKFFSRVHPDSIQVVVGNEASLPQQVYLLKGNHGSPVSPRQIGLLEL